MYVVDISILINMRNWKSEIRK